jgi:hypothetical protein
MILHVLHIYTHGYRADTRTLIIMQCTPDHESQEQRRTGVARHAVPAVLCASLVANEWV